MVTQDITRRSEAGTELAQSPALCRCVTGSALTITLFLLLSNSSVAANWEFNPMIGAAAIYTDNLLLEPDVSKEDDFVTRGEAGFQLSNEDGRLTGDIDYVLQGFFYDSNSNRDETFHQLDARLLGELIPESLFLAGNARFFQTVADPEQPIPFSNVSPLSENRTDALTYEANPYVEHTFGASTELFLSYSFLRADFQDEEVLQGAIDDSDRTRGIFSLGSQTEDNRFNWLLSYDNSEVEYDLATLNRYRYETASVDLGVPLGAGFQVVGIYGYETDVSVNASDGGLDSDFWEAGFRYRAGRRNTLDARVGERFFGDSYFFEWDFDGAAFSSYLSYVERPSTIGLEQFLRPVIEDPEPGAPPVRVSPLTTEVFLDKTATGELAWNRGRTTLTIYASSSTQEFQSAPDDEEFDQAGLIWTWALGPRTDLEIGGFWIHYGYRGDFQDTDMDGIPETPNPNEVDDYFVRAMLGLRRQIGPRLSASLEYRREERTSDSPFTAVFREYEENAVTLEVQWTLIQER